MKTGLVLEGGACRGVFTTGVLDVLHKMDVAFDYCVGVSAGAGNAMNYRSGQIERAFHIVAGSGGASYYGLSAARHSGRLVDLDLVYRTLSYEGDYPFDFGAYWHSPTETEYVLTCCETGQAAYLSETENEDRLIEIVKASCSMPGICGTVKIDGKHYLDGGIADPLPVRHALVEKNCDKVVLVTTKPRENLQPTDYRRMRRVLHRMYGRRYPELFAVLMQRTERYFAELRWIEEQEQAGRVFVIRPRHCEIRTLERDREKMQAYFRHGREVCEDNWEHLASFLMRT